MIYILEHSGPVGRIEGLPRHFIGPTKEDGIVQI